MTSKKENVIEVSDLVKLYPGVRAVDGVSFQVHKGEIFGMLGPNGAGKTTTIECIEGLRTNDSGSIRVLDMDPRKNGYDLREKIGIQFQSASLPERTKVWEALDLFSALYTKSIPWEPLLEKMGLEDKRNTYLAKLSGGQKQRVFIALALVNDPEIVFLDELTTGLDPQSRRAMWDLVLNIRDREKTVFMTTHFMEEAERLCDRVAIIDHGKIVALDSPQNLVNSLGDENRIVFESKEHLDIDRFRELSGATRVEKIGDRFLVYGKKEGLTSRVVNNLDGLGIQYSNLHAEQPTLEDVFLKITGKEMRD